MIQTEAPAAHRSPVTKPTPPRSQRPTKPKGPEKPKPHQKKEAPSRSKKETGQKKGKQPAKKSAGLDERDIIDIGDGVLLRIPSLGTLPN